MNSLRSKLWLSVGGLLAILLVVGGSSIVVLTYYKDALEQTFRENYDSARYCDRMKAALDDINSRAQRLIWDRVDRSAQSDIDQFDGNLSAQFGNITLPGERELTEKVSADWAQFKKLHTQFEQSDSDRQAVYRDKLLPMGEQIKTSVQQISEMNMNNMVSVDGQVKRTLLQVRSVVIFLVAVGTLLATVFTALVGASILRSISALTRSARQIESGNLDMKVEVASGDEIGQLADAFNSMAGRLREFRKLDHERLVRTQRTTQLAIDSMTDPVFIISPDGVVEISNRIAQTHFGAMPGVSIAQLNLDWLTKLYTKITATRQPVEPSDYKSAVQLFDKGERFLLPYARPMLAEDGALVGVTVILVDVTALRHADELKGDLVSTVSHELRTPLTSIRMGTMLLAEESIGPLNDRQRRSIKAVQEDGERLQQTIDNLLNFSRIEAGRAKFQLQPMSPQQIVQSAVAPLMSLYEQKKVKLTVTTADDLPPTNADAHLIGLALSNLLSNAFKFTPPGGEVRLDVKCVNDEIHFTVSDTGPGIPAEYAERIFEKFFRIPSRNGPSGAGLGLSIAREIAHAHAGEIRLLSPSPATFVLSLPAAQVPAMSR